MNTSRCAVGAIPTPALFGTEILTIDTSVVNNFTYDIPQGKYASRHAFNVTGLDFCNVSIEYTHPGHNDNVNIQVWLPLNYWNGNFQGTGGGGFSVGLSLPAMAGAVAEGYAVASTDGGHTTEVTEDWVLDSPGNINWPLVFNFGSRVLYDTAVVGKAITQSFYGAPPEYSYFTGCSTGGRQGLALAQQWPEQYDGILAGSPGINYNELAASLIWAQLKMEWLQEYPEPCQLSAITEAAIEACDSLDGVADGIITQTEKCNFDPQTLVNSSRVCPETGNHVQISAAAVDIASSLWTGPRSVNNEFLWHGLGHQAPLTSLANTSCDGDGCTGIAYDIAKEYIGLFVEKDPGFDYKSVTHEMYGQIFRRAVQEYGSILGSSDPDLRRVRDAGAKIIMWHGTADQLVPINGSRQYYDQVWDIDPGLADYLRYFEAPGVYHCREGPGPYPGTVFDDLVAWVEDGTAPERLRATSLINAPDEVFERDLCQYPQVQRYSGGDAAEPDSFECV